VRRQQGIRHVVGIGRLRQIVDGAEFHGRDRGGDVAITGQHDRPRVGADARQLGDHVEPVTVLEPHVNHGKGRRLVPDEIEALCYRMSGAHMEAARLHGAGEALEKSPVVVDDNERGILWKLVSVESQVFGHGEVLLTLLFIP
jgi:hypothetical protein